MRKLCFLFVAFCAATLVVGCSKRPVSEPPKSSQVPPGSTFRAVQLALKPGTIQNLDAIKMPASKSINSAVKATPTHFKWFATTLPSIETNGYSPAPVQACGTLRKCLTRMLISQQRRVAENPFFNSGNRLWKIMLFQITTALTCTFSTILVGQVLFQRQPLLQIGICYE